MFLHCKIVIFAFLPKPGLAWEREARSYKCCWQARGCFTTRLSAAGMPCNTLRNVLPESGMNVWRAMPHKPCHALQCLCSAVRCNATRDNALQCDAYCVVQCSAVQYVVLWCAVQCCAVLCRVGPRVVLRCAAPCYASVCCAISCSALLCSAMLGHAMVCLSLIHI